MRLKEWECIQEISEEIAYEKKVLRDMRAKMAELESRCSQWKVSREGGGGDSGDGDGQSSFPPTGRLSLQSPYPTTTGPDIARYPIAKRYISWEVPFPAYEPPYYSQPVEHFDADSRPFVDEDHLLPKQQQQERELSFREKPSALSFKWNDMEYSVGRSGARGGGSIIIDRRCWPPADGEFTTTATSGDHYESRSRGWKALSASSSPPSSSVAPTTVAIEYKVEVGTQLPLNPHGRTGVRGRGANRRWGPNHHLLLAIVHAGKGNNRGQSRLLLERNEHNKLRLIEVRCYGRC